MARPRKAPAPPPPKPPPPAKAGRKRVTSRRAWVVMVDGRPATMPITVTTGAAACRHDALDAAYPKVGHHNIRVGTGTRILRHAVSGEPLGELVECRRSDVVRDPLPVMRLPRCVIASGAAGLTWYACSGSGRIRSAHSTIDDAIRATGWIPILVERDGDVVVRVYAMMEPE